MTPKQYRDRGRGRGLDISWACVNSRLGQVLLAATDRGLCFLSFGDDEAVLLAELQAEFENARLHRASAKCAPWLSAWEAWLNDYFTGLEAPLPQSLDVRGTPFQTRVWRYLQGIPRGTTQTYTQVAEGIGKPRAVRAVASACANNDVSLVIPCHRVLRTDGGLAGYRWGIERKQKLLDLEREAPKE